MQKNIGEEYPKYRAKVTIKKFQVQSTFGIFSDQALILYILTTVFLIRISVLPIFYLNSFLIRINILPIFYLHSFLIRTNILPIVYINSFLSKD